MRVLLVDASDRGGIARYTDHLAAGLVNEGIDVKLASAGERAQGSLRLWNVRWTQGPTSQWERLTFYPRRLFEIPLTAWSLLRAVRATTPDVVHVHTAVVRRLDHLLFRIIRRKHPVVLTLHNVIPHESSAREQATEERRWAAADMLVVHNQDVADIVTGRIRHAAVRVVEVDLLGGATGIDGVTARQHLGLSVVPLALMLGLVRPYKGFDLMADVWPAVHLNRPEAILAVVGEAPEEFEAIRRLQQEPNVLTVLRWLGDEEIELWAAAADVCLLPYGHGAHSGVLHRAVANGTPVIVAPCLADEARRFAAGPVVPLVADEWITAVTAALTTPLPTPSPPSPGSLARQMVELYRELLDRLPTGAPPAR